jgi:hypothetical protein
MPALEKPAFSDRPIAPRFGDRSGCFSGLLLPEGYWVSCSGGVGSVARLLGGGCRLEFLMVLQTWWVRNIGGDFPQTPRWGTAASPRPPPKGCAGCRHCHTVGAQGFAPSWRGVRSLLDLAGDHSRSPHGLREFSEHRLRCLKIDTGIRNALPIHQLRQVRLDRLIPTH